MVLDGGYMTDPVFFRKPDGQRIKRWAYTDGGVIIQQPRYLENSTKYAIGVVKTGGVSARSGSTAGSGDVTIYKAETSTLATTGRDVTAYNLDDVAYSSGEYVTLMKEYSTGKWVVIQGAGCDCGVGDVAFFDAPGGSAATSDTFTAGTITFVLSVDSSSYSDGDTLTITASLTYSSDPVPASTTIWMQSSSTSTRALGDGPTNKFLYDHSIATSDATTSNSTSTYLDELKLVNPVAGVADTLTVTTDYTLNWPSSTLECNGWAAYIAGGVYNGFSYTSWVSLYFNQC